MQAGNVRQSLKNNNIAGLFIAGSIYQQHLSFSFSGAVSIFQPRSSRMWPERIPTEFQRNHLSSCQQRGVLLPPASPPSPERLSGREAVRHVTAAATNRASSGRISTSFLGQFSIFRHFNCFIPPVEIRLFAWLHQTLSPYWGAWINKLYPANFLSWNIWNCCRFSV